MPLLLNLAPLEEVAKTVLADLKEEQGYQFGDFPEYADLLAVLTRDDFDFHIDQLKLLNDDEEAEQVHEDVVVLMILSVNMAIRKLSTTISTEGMFEKGWLLTKQTVSNLSTRVTAIEDRLDGIDTRLITLERNQDKFGVNQLKMLGMLKEISKKLDPATGTGKKRSKTDGVDEEAINEMMVELERTTPSKKPRSDNTNNALMSPEGRSSFTTSTSAGGLNSAIASDRRSAVAGPSSAAKARNASGIAANHLSAGSSVVGADRPAVTDD